MKRIWLAVAIGLASLAALAGLRAEQPSAAKDDMEDVMQKKLDHAQGILAALATEDFDAISKNAAALNDLGKRRWREKESADYRAQHKVFWFANQELIRLAEEKNIDGAALAYVQLTLSCVNCHKALRAN